jgi:hypothetical protein
MKHFMRTSALIALAFINAYAPSAQAAQAAAAPTKPVYSKPLSAPEIQSDNRKLQAILDKEDAPANVVTAPQAAPQTILVMPSAAAAPPEPAPAVIAQPVAVAPPAVVTPPPVQQRVQVEPEVAPEPDQEASVPTLGFHDMSGETNGWYEWTREPTSVFTACIALFTFMLAMAGGYHVYVAGSTARRQLRAYVFITQTEINGVAAQTQPVSQLVIRNTGQTPAHDVMVYGNMVFDEFPLKKDLPVLVFSDPQLTRENLGPGSERYKWEYALTPLTEDQIAKMHAGTHALYVYGEIRYRDVFKKKRFTKYLYFTGGNMGIRGTILGGYPEGNEAI